MMEKKEEHILLVEDESSIVRQYQAYLSSKYANILTAGNGKAALEIFQAKKDEGTQIPVIVTDVEMPEMDGITLIHRVLAICPETQFIVISMLHDKHHVSLLTAKGVASLPKPVHGLHLQIAVGSALIRYSEMKWMSEMKRLVEKAPWLHQA